MKLILMWLLFISYISHCPDLTLLTAVPQIATNCLSMVIFPFLAVRVMSSYRFLLLKFLEYFYNFSIIFLYLTFLKYFIIFLWSSHLLDVRTDQIKLFKKEVKEDCVFTERGLYTTIYHCDTIVYHCIIRLTFSPP